MCLTYYLNFYLQINNGNNTETLHGYYNNITFVRSVRTGTIEVSFYSDRINVYKGYHISFKKSLCPFVISTLNFMNYL